MNTTSVNIVSNLISLSWLTGPIFDKELRVSSRRRRNYFLRSGYVLLLSIFMLSAWYSTIGIGSSGSALYQVSRLSQLGRTVVIFFIWFQFVVAQLMAVVMLSSSISDEIRMGTLSVLMTTPINSFQIVTGKLLSRLLQVILLLAISLPLLAIIRVFGGVPWSYIVSSICITMTAAVFAGALSLLLSMIYRHAYSVIMVITVGYLLFFGALPGFIIWLAANGAFNQQSAHSIIALVNPFWAIAATTQEMFVPSAKILNWPIHCLIMLAATAVLLTISLWKVRKVALNESFAGAKKFLSKRTVKNTTNTGITSSQTPAGPVKRVTGSPIVWKEMYKGFLGAGRTDRTITVVLIGLSILTAILLFITPILLFITPMTDIFTHYLMSGFYLVVMIRLAVSIAGSIASEKEARTWPILLMTPLEDREIIRGKVYAAIKRNILLLLLYQVLIFFNYISIGMRMFPQTGISIYLQLLIGLPLTAAGIVCSVLFVIGSGSYFGVRLRTATSAIAATVGSYLVMTYFFCGMFNPLRIILINTIMRNRMNLYIMYLAVLIVPKLAQGGLGIFLERRAVRRLRRDIF